MRVVPGAVEGGQWYKVFNGLGIVKTDSGSYISMWLFLQGVEFL
jgi:hypothetical protein